MNIREIVREARTTESFYGSEQFAEQSFPWGTIKITGSAGLTPRDGASSARIEINIYDSSNRQVIGWTLDSETWGWEDWSSSYQPATGPEDGLAKARAWLQQTAQKYV